MHGIDNVRIMVNVFVFFHTATENCLGNSQQRQEFFKTLRPTYGSRDLVVGVVIMIRPGKSEALFSVGVRDSSSTKILSTGCGVHTGFCSMITYGSFARAKVTRNEADRSTPFSADVRNKWNYTSVPLYTFFACIETTFTFWSPHASK